jgi:hypothetical protein
MKVKNLFEYKIHNKKNNKFKIGLIRNEHGSEPTEWLYFPNRETAEKWKSDLKLPIQFNDKKGPVVKVTDIVQM